MTEKSPLLPFLNPGATTRERGVILE